MKKPERDIPKAVIVGGLVIALVYIISSFGIGAAIPVDKITSDLGVIDAINTMIGSSAFWIVVFAGILFLITLFGNIISWSYGVNYVAQYGARHGDMPKIFKPMNEKRDMPIGAPIVNGVVASLIVIVSTIIYYVNPNSNNMFWAFFSLSIIMLLLSYMFIFPAFLKLRKCDAKTKRPYKVPGGEVVIKLFAIVPVVILILTVLLSLFPIPETINGTLQFTKEGFLNVLPTIIGVILTIIVGEIIVFVLDKKNKVNQKRGKNE
jgi:amino acid transporter